MSTVILNNTFKMTNGRSHSLMLLWWSIHQRNNSAVSPFLPEPNWPPCEIANFSKAEPSHADVDKTQSSDLHYRNDDACIQQSLNWRCSSAWHWKTALDCWTDCVSTPTCAVLRPCLLPIITRSFSGNHRRTCELQRYPTAIIVLHVCVENKVC